MCAHFLWTHAAELGSNCPLAVEMEVRSLPDPIPDTMQQGEETQHRRVQDASAETVRIAGTMDSKPNVP